MPADAKDPPDSDEKTTTRKDGLGLGVVTRERCLQTVGRSAEWVLGLDVNTNSTGFTVLHAPTGTPSLFLCSCVLLEGRSHT